MTDSDNTAPSAPGGDQSPSLRKPTPPPAATPGPPAFPPPGPPLASGPPAYAPPPAYPPPAGEYPPPGGHYSPPGAGYPSPPGAGFPSPPGAGFPQPGQVAPMGADERAWVLLSHFGAAVMHFFTGALFGWVAPLIALLAKGNQSPVVRAHAVDSINFQVTWALVAAVGWTLFWCGSVVTLGFGALVFWIFPAIPWLVSMIMAVIAGLKASNNEPYRYPMAIKFLK